MNSKFLVSSSPHIGFGLTTKKIMIHVIIALSFTAVAGIVTFGFYSFLVIGVSILSTVVAETLYNLISKRKNTVKDCSSVVSGMILGLILPPTVPLYVPFVGGMFAIIIVKMLFGGLGRNFANPAAAGRIFVALSWTKQMSVYIPPVNYENGVKAFFVGFTKNYVTSATPLAGIKETASGFMPVGETNLMNMFLGQLGGSIGEVCKLAILLGAIYLIVVKVIDWKILVTYLISCVVCTFMFYKNPVSYILPNLLSGGILFGAVFMLTDYATSPNTGWGRVTFAALAGLFTMLIRRFGAFPEGVAFSILLVNIVTPLIDKICKPRPFGYVNKNKKPKENKGAL